MRYCAGILSLRSKVPLIVKVYLTDKTNTPRISVLVLPFIVAAAVSVPSLFMGHFQPEDIALDRPL
jgi:hypothetical protein